MTGRGGPTSGKREPSQWRGGKGGRFRKAASFGHAHRWKKHARERKLRPICSRRAHIIRAGSTGERARKRGEPGWDKKKYSPRRTRRDLLLRKEKIPKRSHQGNRGGKADSGLFLTSGNFPGRGGRVVKAGKALLPRKRFFRKIT